MTLSCKYAVSADVSLFNFVATAMQFSMDHGVEKWIGNKRGWPGKPACIRSDVTYKSDTNTLESVQKLGLNLCSKQWDTDYHEY